ncbi:MAG: tyrosine-protein phosphatase [Acetobacteraceae bacterium]
MTDLPRAIALEGVSNLRDLGGWPVAGGRIRFGRVFRAAALAGMTATDAARLAGLGLKTVCDLRGREEAAGTPSRLDLLPGVRAHALSIEPSIGASLRALLAASDAADASTIGPTAPPDAAAADAPTEAPTAVPTTVRIGADALTLMRQAYVGYALDWSHRYRTLFDLLADPAGPPLLFHCSAGKDRTGFAAALILTALGASRETVLADYLATRRFWRGDAAMAAGLPAQAAAALLGVDATLLDAAFAAIATVSGGFAGYAADRLGLTPQRLKRLRAALVEPG